MLTNKMESNGTRFLGTFSQKINAISGKAEWEEQEDGYDFHQEIARSAFADMLHDKERNRKYYDALKLAIDKFHSKGVAANILDIGTGTGLLSMMAVKCGADSVVACEAFKPVADCALEVIKDNKYADRITVIPKRSTMLTVGPNGDMKVKANILVTEVFDTELIGEGALETLAHAHRELLEKDCIVVPHSATIYAQVVECPDLFKWNKLMDIASDDGNILLKTPVEVKECSGGSYIHDLQLSQIPRHSFRELLKPIPVLKFDWSGKTAISKKNVALHMEKCVNTGQAQMVFMWWDLQMDTEGQNVLSCAPWWAHPDAEQSSPQPSETIPWRDHWMQGIYYFPKEVLVNKDQDICIVSAHDEFSLWFHIKNDSRKAKSNDNPPICTCGMHFMFSRTHISYINDGKRNKKFLKALSGLNKESTLLCLNGASLIGLAAAEKAKKVFYVESNKFTEAALKSYVKYNNLMEHVEIIKSLEEIELRNITHIFIDPNFASAILPWHNLQFISKINKIRSGLKNTIHIIPDSFTIRIMPVEFLDLQKIRAPLEECEGFLMQKFDALIEKSRNISDFEIESQPLWEYPGYCRAKPADVISIATRNAIDQYSSCGSITFQEIQKINGCALWIDWTLNNELITSNGPIIEPDVGEYISWDSHTRQGVQLFMNAKTTQPGDKIDFHFNCDFDKDLFNISMNFVKFS